MVRSKRRNRWPLLLVPSCSGMARTTRLAGPFTLISLRLATRSTFMASRER
ncbi:hypothetical protein ACFPRL_27020 [Pseudoclavibacter helvolus]